MMAQDSGELVVAAHGDVYVAPVGTTLPTGAEVALDAAFVNLGLISEDGATLNVAPDIEEFMAWQRRQAVRRELTRQEITISFALEQWNAANVVLAFGGGTVTQVAPSEWRYSFPDEDDSLDERSIVLDWQDGPDKSYRAVFERGNVSDNVETSLQRSELSLLPIQFSVLSPDTGGSPGDIYVADAAFAS